MKIKVKILTLILMISFLPTMSSCDKGKEISAEKAYKVIENIEDYWKDNYKEHLNDEYTKTLTSKSSLNKNGNTSKINIKVKIALKNGVIYNNSNYYYGKDHINNKKSKTYMYQKDGNYFINDTQIDKKQYEFTKSSSNVSYISSSYLETMENLVYMDINDYSMAICKYYSNGEGSIVIFKELTSKVEGTVYTHKQKIVYKDYMFISNEEQEEIKGGSINVRTESMKYKAFINNPYK